MILEGPTEDTSIPAGSVIVCSKPDCRTPIYITLINLRSGISSSIKRDFVPLVRRPHFGLEDLCPACGQKFMTNTRRLHYLSPPESLGERIIHFISWGHALCSEPLTR